MNGKIRLGLQQAAFGWVNFALTAPAIYLWLGLPLIMRQQGWSGTEIGLFQLAGLPAVFKVLLAIPVERWPHSGPAYRRWACWMGGGFALCLLALAAAGEQSGKVTLFVLMLLAALLSTWADIPVQALAIGMLPAQARPLAGGIRAAATFAGAVVGGGAMLLVQQTRGWVLPFLILAAGVLSALVMVAVLGRRSGVPEQAMPAVSPVSAVPGQAPWHVWRGFFRQPGAPAWTLLLVGQFPFVAAAWVFLKPLLLDHGLPAGQVAAVAGVGGGTLGACASMAAGLVRRERLKSAALRSAWGNVLALALLALALASGAGVAGVLAGSAALALAMGAASSLAFALMMEFTRDGRRAADYGLQAGLFSLSRIIVPPLAGLVLDRFGDAAMLAALAAGALCTALAARRCLR